jgi:hypothetical protein
MYAVIYWEKVKGAQKLFSLPKILTDDNGFILQYKEAVAADVVADNMESQNPNVECRTISLESVIE